MGHGIGAAAMMAQLRTGLRAYALDGHSPSGVVERLNRLALTLGAHQMTTLVVAFVDLARERATIVSAGHLPPVLRFPGGETTLLTVEGDAPLGVSPGTRYHEHEFEFPTGSLLLLVTDGAVEVRGESLEHGLERLRGVVAAGGEPGAVGDHVAAGLVRGQPGDDDVAVRPARHDLLPERLDTSWPASTDTLAAMRPLLRRWLDRWGAAEDEAYDIIVAVQEASANAVEHAYAPGEATFDVSAEHAHGVITFTIRDRGNWRAPRGQHRGRGLSMMRALMEDVDVTHDERGTLVVLRRTLTRKAA
jgi:anti-sigma regulatory factor (Ser/Thr protein kinase)